MGAIAQAAFDPKPRRLGAVLNLIAGEAIRAGSVVGFANAGVDWTIYNALSGSTAAPLGIALYSAAVGEKIAVASIGSIVRVKNALDNAALEAGTSIMGSTITSGHVVALDALGSEQIGYLLEALPASAVPAYAYITGSIKLTKG